MTSKPAPYSLEFHPLALKEWKRLGPVVKEQFKLKLTERLENPRVEGDCIAKDRYKIKLRSAGYRLVYEVMEKRVVVYVLAVGKRERLEAYKKAESRKSK